MRGRKRASVGMLRRLCQSRKGATLPLIGFALLPMMAALGGAVDVGRIYITRSQMQAGVNAAALAGANAFDNESESDENGRYKQAASYYKDNVPNGYMGTSTPGGVSPYGGTTTMLKPEFSLSAKGISRTDVTASADIPMTFMSIFKINTYRIDVTAHAEFQPHPLEVMVVLDNTGSMKDPIDGVSKMSSLKTAMHNFLNILYQGANEQPELAIGIINYTITTNVGAILKAASVKYQAIPGYTDRNWEGGDALGWKGCVSDDETTNTMSTSMTTSEADAYDIWATLPGEKPKSSSPHDMLPIKPYYYPPIFQSMAPPKGTAWNKADPKDNFYKKTGDSNGFRPTGGVSESALYNMPIYKRYIYRLYKGLNNGAANMADDVIVAVDGKSYYDPTVPGAYDDLTGAGLDFYVRAEMIPNRLTGKADGTWKDATPYNVTSDNTPQPTPNWQCPEAGLPITYGVSKSFYDNYVDSKVWPIMPANGTTHHIGFLWGWRLLARYDIFKRTPPAGAGAPLRALVFMTDGESNVGSVTPENADRLFTAYGAPAEKVVATATDGNSYKEAIKLRFKKACGLANTLALPDSGKPPKIYTVAINKDSSVGGDKANLVNCGTAGSWITTSPTALNDAFQQIARDLVDIHLVQ